MGAIEWIFVIALSGLVFAIVLIDMKTFRIPDQLNASVFGLGVLFLFFTRPETLLTQLIFAVVVFAAFWLFQRTHEAITGRLGLGFGDVKMFGAAAIWISPWNFPILLFFASASALLFVSTRYVGQSGLSLQTRIPFGPFIGAGLVLTLIFQEQNFWTYFDALQIP